MSETPESNIDAQAPLTEDEAAAKLKLAERLAGNVLRSEGGPVEDDEDKIRKDKMREARVAANAEYDSMIAQGFTREEAIAAEDRVFNSFGF